MPLNAKASKGARRAMERADVIVRVIDVTRSFNSKPDEAEILAANKIDLLTSGLPSPGRGIPIRGDLLPHRRGNRRLVDAVVVRARGDHPAEAPMLAAINARHQACLQRASSGLQEAEEGLSRKSADPELVAVPLREALDAAGEVVGSTDIEEILGEIFGKFCIGK